MSWEPQGTFDLVQTLGILARGRLDPVIRFDDTGSVWLAFSTAAGPATLRIHRRAHGGVRAAAPGEGTVVAQAWGEGAGAALASVPALIGLTDDWSGFDAQPFHSALPALVRKGRHLNPGVRLPATGRMLDAVVVAILEQKVTGIEAKRAWRQLVTTYGSRAPGPAPAGLRIPPTADQWRRVPSWDWHRAGVGPQRSAVVLRAVQRAAGLERLAALPAAEAGVKLQSLSGIGPWTAAEVTQRTHGDPDSVSVGDYHLAAYVGWALRGKPVDDEVMLELLEPWHGNRQRVVRMLYASGFRKPMFGPRLAPADHRFR